MNKPSAAEGALPNTTLNAVARNAQAIRLALLFSLVGLAIIEQGLSIYHESLQEILLASLGWLVAGSVVFWLGWHGRPRACSIGILALFWFWLASQEVITGGMPVWSYFGYVALVVAAGVLLEEFGAAVAVMVCGMTCLVLWELGSGSSPLPLERTDSFLKSLHHAMGAIMAGWIMALMLWHLFRSRQSILLSERRFNSLLESAPDVMIVCNRRQDIVFVNELSESFFGYRPDELLGQPLSLLLPERYREIHRSHVERFMAQPHKRPMGMGMDLWGLRKDGSEFPVDINLNSLETEEGPLAIAAIRDLTARQSVEEALRASEIRFRAIYEGSSDAIMLLSDKEFFDCNARTLEVFGIASKERFFHLHPSQVSPPLQPDGRESFVAAAEHIAQAFREGTHRFEWMHRRANGEDFPAEVLLSAFDYGGQRVLQATVRDITERRQVEIERQRFRQELEERVRQRTQELESANAALRKSEGRYRSLTETSSDMVSMLEIGTGICRYVSPACHSLLGYVPEEILGHSAYEFFFSEDIAKIRQDHLDFRDLPGVVHTTTYRAVRKDGSLVWCETNETIVHEGDDQPVYVLAVSRDITARKQVETQLEHDRTFLRSLLDAIPDQICYKDRENRFLGCNQAFARFVNQDEAAIIGKTDADLFAAATAAINVAADLQAINSGVPQRHEDWEVAADGQPVLFDTIATPYRGGAGSLLGLIRIRRDTTDRAKTQEQLRLLSRAIESSPVSVVITDKAGTISYVNAKFCQVTGYSSAEVIGKNHKLLNSGVHPREFYQEMWNALNAGQEWHGEFCNKKKNGELYWEAQSISPVRDEQGRVKHFVAVREDITERMRIAVELEAAKEAAETANRAKSAFLAHMSHEIRTPLNAVLGFAQLLETDATLGRQQAEYVGIINRSGEFLLALINDILEMSKIEVGRTVIKASNFNLQTTLAALVTMFKIRTDQKQLWLRLEKNPTLPRSVYADEGKVRQILINLIGNAVKFTSKGGITVRSRMYFSPSHEWRLTIEVEDTGSGIALADQEKIFEPFVQAKNGRELAGGTGLGLAISRSFSRLMGGDVTVSSRPGQGSIFALDIPVRCSDSPASSDLLLEEMVIGLLPGQPEQRILVADGNDSSRLLLTQMLAPIGFAVRAAADAATAVEQAKAWQPQLILMDIGSLPHEGADVIAPVKALAGEPAIKVVAVTAKAFKNDRQSLLDAGFDDVLVKPFRREELFAKLEAQLKITYVRGQKMRQAAAVSTLSRDQLGQQLSQLPPELLRKIREAASGGYLYQLYGLIDEAAKHDPAVAKGLRELADAYDYEAFGRLLGS